MIRGLRFKIPNDHNFYLMQILKGLEDKNYVWKVDEDEILHKSYSLFQLDGPSVCNSMDFFQKISKKPYLVVFANIQAYSNSLEFVEINDYNDFEKSECHLILLICDSIFVDVYAKDMAVIETIKSNVTASGFSNIDYITELNDVRYTFHAWAD